MEHQKKQKFQKICNKIILKHLQMRMIKKYLKERYISPEERQKNIDNLRALIIV